jgi:hypothetical protein
MILIKEGIDFYILYTDSAQFMGNGDMETIRSILRRYAKRAGGNRMRFNSLINRIYYKDNVYPKHERYVIDLWDSTFRADYEEDLESMISELLKENEVKVSIPKIRVIGKKKNAPKKKIGLIKIRH